MQNKNDSAGKLLHYILIVFSFFAFGGTKKNEHSMVKNPSWQEADQLALYKCELRTTENNTTR